MRLVQCTFARTLACFFLLAACGPEEQPESSRFVAAVEINLQTPADRSDLLEMLNRRAAADGLHVDDVSREAERNANSLPAFARRTIYIGLWRGRADDDLEVSVDDAGHQGKAWVIFSRGARPEVAARLRDSLMNDLFRRWPHARRVPILPSGGLPSVDDLRLTTGGYKIVRSAASRYQLTATSPLLTPEVRTTMGSRDQ